MITALKKCSHSLHNNMIRNHLCALNEKLDVHSSSCSSKFVILIDFNVEMEEQQREKVFS